MNKPVVINVSLGSGLGPHDGFTSTEDWLTDRFDARPRAAYVCSAGNDAGSSQHGRLDFTGPDSVDVGIELKDNPRVRTTYSYCETRSDIPESMKVQIYYPPTAGPITVTFDPKDGEAPRAGPERGAAAVPVPVTFEGFEAVMTHVLEEQPRPYTGAGLLQRSKFELEMKAKKDAAGKNPGYRDETYTLHVTAPGTIT